MTRLIENRPRRVFRQGASARDSNAQDVIAQRKNLLMQPAGLHSNPVWQLGGDDLVTGIGTSSRLGTGLRINARCRTTSEDENCGYPFQKGVTRTHDDSCTITFLGELCCS